MHGTLYQADAETPLAGARAFALNVTTRARYVSEVTGENGAFEIRGLPGGTYDVVFEVEGGLFVAENLVDLGAHESRSLDYTIQALRPANRLIPGMRWPSGSAQTIEAFTAVGGTALDFWSGPLGLVILAVLGFGAGYALADDDDPQASPSSP